MTLVDGTLIKALPRITEAMWLSTRTGTRHQAWRLHTHFELDKHIPVRMDLTNGRNSGDSDERTVLRQHLESNRCYVMDRWYPQFTLFNDIHRAQSSYVCRVRDNSAYEIEEERPLSAEAIAAGVVSDQIVRMGVKSKKMRPFLATGGGSRQGEWVPTRRDKRQGERAISGRKTLIHAYSH